MKHIHPLRTATTALALLACIAAPAMAQTAPQHWPWGSGFERRNATAPTAQPEPLPVAPDTVAAVGNGDGRRGKAQGGGAGSTGGGRGNSGNGRGR
ncbi:MAG: hypothetical protein Q8S32_03595 [Burkholderiaceae bacterium]|nr:hypothetical protein [Burkholderiaceae bacterium]